MQVEVVLPGRPLEALLGQFMVFEGVECARVAQARLLSWWRFILQSLHMLREHQTMPDLDLATCIEKGDPTMRAGIANKAKADRACIFKRIESLIPGATE